MLYKNLCDAVENKTAKIPFLNDENLLRYDTTLNIMYF